MSLAATRFASINPDAPLVLVGGGRMGGALASGWLAAGLDPKSLLVIDPAPPQDVAAALTSAGVRVQATPPAGTLARLLVIAVKPQIVGTVLPALKPLVGPNSIALSIAAGITIATLEAGLSATVIRAMPNTPAQIGRGITAAVANARVDAAGRALATDLLKAVGEVVWVDDEALIDPVTAVSGSGPAYVFLLAECLAEAGEKVGLPGDVAARLAIATVAGAGELLGRSGTEPATLRKNVTSPNGTTEAALKILMGEDGLQQLMTEAVAAAARRSRELAG
jgi:pyrroline-5-carboxylate reductase